MFRPLTYLLAAALVLLAGSAMAQTIIATADGETSGLRIEITELKRSSGDTVTLKFKLLNETGDSLSYYSDLGNYDMSGIELIDAAGRKKYLVIKDSEGKCLCSAGLSTLKAGESTNLWARFPAPPAEVKVVEILFPHFIPTEAALSD